MLLSETGREYAFLLKYLACENTLRSLFGKVCPRQARQSMNRKVRDNLAGILL